MHLLTKIFVVLVSLLAVMLVPLVVVYASNEDSFRAKYQRADLERAGAREELNAEKLRYSAETQRLQGEIDKLIAENEQITRDRDDKLADIRRLERDLAMTQSQQAQFQSDAERVTLTDLSESLPQLLAAGDIERVFIRADSLADYGPVLQTIAITATSGTPFSLVAEPWRGEL